MSLTRIDFSHNWNHKLDCDYYTSIRIRNDEKYVVGNYYEVFFKKDKHHESQLVDVRHMFITQLNEFIAGLDTGYSLEECKNILLKMYPNVDFNNKQITLLLFKKNTEKTADKIGQFCSMYEKFTGIKYKISRAEIGMIKNVKVDERLLLAYFQSEDWWAKVKSVTNYVKNYNEIRAVALGKKASEFPNYWSEIAEKKIPTHKLSDYWKHLRDLGYEPIYHPGTTTVKEWKLKK